ncbi:MAG: hypothetical protein VW397_02350, partial [Candidatus Margulisiibacteriota bacterium]
GQENKKWLSSITPPKTPLTQQIQDQKYLYHQLTEHYRYLLSIIYDIAKENIDPKQLNELNHDDIQRMALLSSHLNTEILLNASELALHNRHPQIFSDDIKKAYQSIRKKLNLSNQNMTKKQTSFIFLFNLKKVSKKIIKNKMEALS